MKGFRNLLILAASGGWTLAWVAAGGHAPREQNEVVAPASDFQSSCVTWVLPPGDDPRPYSRHNLPSGNKARILLESFIDVIDERTGATERFVLTVGHPTEWMFVEDRIFHIPSKEWRAIYSLKEVRNMGPSLTYQGKPSRGRRWRDRSPTSGAAISSLAIDVRRFPRTRVLKTHAEIDAAIWSKVPLVGRTEIRDPKRRERYLLEYPIIIISSVQETGRFQVDTGPVLVPDFTSEAESIIDRLEMAYIAYNRLDRAEFILRRPTPLPSHSEGKPSLILYPSEVREYQARNWLLGGVRGSPPSPASALDEAQHPPVRGSDGRP